MHEQTLTGLTTAEVAARVSAGQVNAVPSASSRSLADIIKANTFTRFNALIGGMWAVMLVIAPIQDSLFGFVIVANTLIGIVQEYRASRTLAKLSVLGEAKPLVVRDGREQEVSASELVLDDVIRLRTGDQVVVDGELLDVRGLEIDESLLTGEADPVDKGVGDDAMSGSFVVAGSGVMRATRIGTESFAGGLTVQAKQFQLTNSELRTSLDGFIRFISYLLIPIGALLIWSQFHGHTQSFTDALRGAIAGMVTMVPEGLILLTSIAMAVAVVRLGAQRVLVQDMPAVEVLARVDTVCMDKTGTLTEPGMHVRDVLPLDGVAQAEADAALAALAAAESNPNPTLAAIAAQHPARDWTAGESVPFSSARKWSACDFGSNGVWLLGAPEMLGADDALRARTDEIGEDGARVLLLCTADALPAPDEPVRSAKPAAIVVIDQRLRHDAADTVRYFLDQGVRTIVISGDNATTVGAIAAEAGVPGADQPRDARELPEDADELAPVMKDATVFGRVSPAQKQAMVGGLHLNGSTVAMTGDGVNDVLALKHADLGIAMGSGAGATRAVAQLVLLDDQWSVMPSVVAEGRRVLGNIERVADVFLTKTVYAIVIALATSGFAVAFPFLPRHLTIVSSLTIGIPGFFLALMPNNERFRPGFLRRVLLFAVPAGIIAATSAFVSYGVALSLGEPTLLAQSAATITLFIVAISVLLQSARPLNPLRIGIVASMVGIFLIIITEPDLSEFFALHIGPERYSIVALVIGGVGALLVWVATLVTDRWRRR